MEKILYNGEITKEAVEEFCKKHSKGCYLFVMVSWSYVSILKTKKILSNPTSPSSYPFGFWKNGVKTQWSSKRLITDQNTGVIQS